jgi:hypothetical protein
MPAAIATEGPRKTQRQESEPVIGEMTPMPVFAKTRSLAGHIYQRAAGEPTRHQALVLLRRLRACEAALASDDGHIPALAQTLLLSLIPAVRELANPAWPTAADANDSAIGAITVVAKIPDPPGLSELDEILARILRHRFAASAETSPPTLASLSLQRPVCGAPAMGAQSIKSSKIRSHTQEQVLCARQLSQRRRCPADRNRQGSVGPADRIHAM